MELKYPSIEIDNNIYREMTPEEYEYQLDWYRNIMENYCDSQYRREKEYGNYLKRWFSDETCDGLGNYELRYKYHTLPMSYNIYFG